jgi:hypothetical protein
MSLNLLLFLHKTLLMMLKRIEKTVITKAIHKHQTKGTVVIKINQERSDGSGYYVIITPGSYTLYFRSHTNYCNPERLSVPRFSDYVVECGEFGLFLDKLKALQGEG